LNYLQARDIEAAGLTIDELRQKLEGALERFYRPPIRVVIIPEAFTSKRYYILGGVVQKGMFVLDRPMTIVEAIARARGFETTLLQRNTLMLADLSRSFLVRKEPDATFRRVDVDFEALFLRADLSQNLTLAPDDYLYFPPLDLKEVYVLGQVGVPGVVPYTPELTVMRAVISRGGFTERAYRKKILVVRGSLSRPETFIVDAAAILDARGTDFPLRPRDIVYVNARPWARVEELLQFAVLEYMRAIVIAWTGQNVGPFTKEPFIPNID
jgi:protein involved in polysaccharide export with SLBB domain